MTGYVARRGLHAVPVILGITFLAFLLIRLTPGDPVTLMLGLRATPDSVAFWHVKFALDDPLPLQYLAFLRSAVTLDFGDSIASRIPVTDLIGSRLGTTLSLMVYSVLISISVAVPLAMWAALRANRMSDHGIKLTMMLTFAMPAFWVGLILIQVFSLRLDWFPASGLRQGVLPYIWSLTLPSVTIALYLSPVLVRSLRTTMISILRTDYVEAARARGLSEARVMRRYVLRNSLTSTVTMIGLSVAGLIGGSLIVENVFALPGIGQLVVQSVNARDFPVLQACVLLIGLWIILANLITDLVNARLDPRTRL
jgi:peptide/nickel transport system permease protein